MPRKEEISEELNEILGTDVDFSRMTKDDLKELKEKAEQGHLIESQAQHVIKNYGKQKLDEVVDEWYPGKYGLKLL